MIKIKNADKSYELCQICTEVCETKLNFEDINGNTTTIKLCADCESELRIKLHERFNDKLSNL